MRIGLSRFNSHSRVLTKALCRAQQLAGNGVIIQKNCYISKLHRFTHTSVSTKLAPLFGGRTQPFSPSISMDRLSRCSCCCPYATLAKARLSISSSRRGVREFLPPMPGDVAGDALPSEHNGLVNMPQPSVRMRFATGASCRSASSYQ